MKQMKTTVYIFVTKLLHSGLILADEHSVWSHERHNIYGAQ